MTKFKERMIVGAVVVGLGVIGMFMNAHQVSATTPPPAGPSVTIAGPLPLPVTGTVNGTVTGTVAATQSGNWNVGITGNSAQNPIFTSAVPAAMQPVLLGQECSTSNSFRCDMSSFYSVPAGKRLVVEYAFAEGDVKPGQHFSCFFFPIVGNVVGSLAVGTQMSNAAAVSGSLTEAFTMVGQPLRFYSDAGSMTASCARDSDDGFATFSLHASGYLVNVP